VSLLLTTYLSQFLVFVLVLTRVGSLLMTLPVLGSNSIPMQVRGLLAVAVSLLITPLHWGLAIPHPNSLLDLGLLIAREAVLGLALGGAVMILLSGMQLAGQVISQMSGMSLADVVNPTFDTNVPIFSNLLEMLALSIFFLMGGHREVMDALLGSFEWMPPGSGRLPTDLSAALSTVASHSFEIGIRASAPVMVSLLLAILIIALISRTLPQLNSIAIGLNLNALIAPAVLALTLGSVAWAFQQESAGIVDKIRDVFLNSPLSSSPVPIP
jgi:flagellar biosynthetic protein FliR